MGATSKAAPHAASLLHMLLGAERLPSCADPWLAHNTPPLPSPHTHRPPPLSTTPPAAPDPGQQADSPGRGSGLNLPWAQDMQQVQHQLEQAQQLLVVGPAPPPPADQVHSAPAHREAAREGHTTTRVTPRGQQQVLPQPMQQQQSHAVPSTHVPQQQQPRLQQQQQQEQQQQQHQGGESLPSHVPMCALLQLALCALHQLGRHWHLLRSNMQQDVAGALCAMLARAFTPMQEQPCTTSAAAAAAGSSAEDSGAAALVALEPQMLWLRRLLAVAPAQRALGAQAGPSGLAAALAGWPAEGALGGQAASASAQQQQLVCMMREGLVQGLAGILQA